MPKHITSRRDRQSAKYKTLHDQLRREQAEPEMDKRDRKRQRSRDFMAGRD